MPISVELQRSSHAVCGESFVFSGDVSGSCRWFVEICRNSVDWRHAIQDRQARSLAATGIPCGSKDPERISAGMTLGGISLVTHHQGRR